MGVQSSCILNLLAWTNRKSGKFCTLIRFCATPFSFAPFLKHKQFLSIRLCFQSLQDEVPWTSKQTTHQIQIRFKVGSTSWSPQFAPPLQIISDTQSAALWHALPKSIISINNTVFSKTGAPLQKRWRSGQDVRLKQQVTLSSPTAQTRKLKLNLNQRGKSRNCRTRFKKEKTKNGAGQNNFDLWIRKTPMRKIECAV